MGGGGGAAVISVVDNSVYKILKLYGLKIDTVPGMRVL